MDKFVKQGPNPIPAKSSFGSGQGQERNKVQSQRPNEQKQSKSSKNDNIELISDDDKDAKKVQKEQTYRPNPLGTDLGKRNPVSQPSLTSPKATSGAIASDSFIKSQHSPRLDDGVKGSDPIVDKMYNKLGERMGLGLRTTNTHHPSSKTTDSYSKISASAAIGTSSLAASSVIQTGSGKSHRVEASPTSKSSHSQQTPPVKTERRLTELNNMISNSLFSGDAGKPDESTNNTSNTSKTGNSDSQDRFTNTNTGPQAKQTAPGVISMALPSDSDEEEKKRQNSRELIPGKDFKTFLTGMSVVFTGMFRCTGNSDDKAPLQEAVRKLGGTASTSVNSKTLYLVAGYQLPDGRETSTSKKYETAVAKSIRILDEVQFSTLVKEQSGAELSRLLGPASDKQPYSADNRYSYKPVPKAAQPGPFNEWKKPKTSPRRRKEKLNAGEIPSDMPLNPVIIHPKPEHQAVSPVAQAVSSVFPKTLKNTAAPPELRKTFSPQPTVGALSLSSSPNVAKMAESAAAFHRSSGFAAGFLGNAAARAAGEANRMLNCPLFPGSLSMGGGGLWGSSSNHAQQYNSPGGGNSKIQEEEPQGPKPSREPSSTWAYPERQAVQATQQVAELWTSKHSPVEVAQIVGNSDGAVKLRNWLRSWKDSSGKDAKSYRSFNGHENNPYAKAVLISGPPGIGKTTAVRVVCKELGYKLIQQNASDVRSKNVLRDSLGVMSTTRTINCDGDLVNKTVILMDEVDGMTSDRGGVAALTEFIKNTKTPVVCICNDRAHPKMRSLAGNCYDIKFHRPAPGYLGPWVEKILSKEGIEGAPGACERLVEEFNSDVRSILTYLENWARKGLKKFTFGNAESKALHSFTKDSSVSLTNFDAASALLNRSIRSEKTYRQLMDYFFIDFEFVPLLVHENYLNAGRKEGDLDTLKKMSRAADSFVKADMSNLLVRRDQNWKLLDTVAFYSSILPCHLFTENIHRCNFPEYLGKFSSERKMQRELRELKEALMKSSTGGELAMKFDYAPALWQTIKFYMSKGDEASLQNLLQLYEGYDLTPDLVKEHLVDVIFNPMKADLMEGIDSKSKASFTRVYNAKFKESVATTRRKARVYSDFDGGINPDGEGEGDDEADKSDHDESSETKIEQIKPAKKAAKPAAKKANGPNQAPAGKRK